MENSVDEVRMQELKIRDDVEYKLDMYQLEDLETIDELDDASQSMAEISREYRHVHVELKNLLAEKYTEAYPGFAKLSEKMRDFEKNAKIKIRKLKKDVIKMEAESEKNTSVNEEKLKLKIVMNSLIAKMDHLNDTVDIVLVKKIEGIDEYISKMEILIADFLDTIEKFKSFCSKGETEKECESFIDIPSEVSQDIKMAKLLRLKLVGIAEKEKEKKSKNVFQQSSLVKAKSLFSEIKLRFESLKCKLDVDLTSLSDYQILEISQNKNLDVEFNDVLEKVTGLAALVPEGGNVAKKLLRDAIALREESVSHKKMFQQNLNKLVNDHDITPEKLKHAAEVIINLPKFSGYNSKMDLFTFKSQYKKHVESKILKKCWADYLKMNYLTGPALNLVEHETDYEVIWERLMRTYGNPRILLQNKMCDLDATGGLWKVRGEDKLFDAIASLVNNMKDLSRLAVEHNIEGQLYEGGGLEKVLFLIGDQRHKKFREQHLDTCGDKKVEWEKILKFLEKELKVKERLILDQKSAQMMGLQRVKKDHPGKVVDEPKVTPKHTGSVNVANNGQLKCHVCDETGHTVITTAKGKKLIPYYVCKKFSEMSADVRLATLNSKNLCAGCLYPGAVTGTGHKCYFTKFCCPDPSHGTEKVHVLVCGKHKSAAKNVDILNKFKEKFINNCPVDLPSFAKSISCFSEMVGVTEVKPVNFEKLPCDPEITDNAIFLLQPINVEGVRLNMFYDGGCGDMVITKPAVDKLMKINRAKQLIPGPLEINGVGETKVISEDGLYTVCLPLRNGNNAVLTGICLPKITSTFPNYHLGVVEGYIRERCKEIGGKKLVEKLPRLPREVGGDTHILLGSKYKKYFPKKVFELDTGLGVHDSVFESVGGTTGVVNGPHKQFTEIEKEYKGHTVYFEKPVLLCRNVSVLDNSLPLLGYKDEMPDMFGIDPPLCCSILKDDILESTTLSDQKAFVGRRPPRCVKQFDEIDTAGTEVMYRCVDCRSCPKCKTSMRLDSVSIQEELEQGLIERSVEVDTVNCRTVAKLPFVVDPETRLVPNESGALRVLKKQVKNLNSKPEDKQMVIEFENKLQDMGFVDYFSNLDDNVRSEILSSAVKYFIPWRAVWNENSLTTPCRMVFDASMGCRSSSSLNSLVAKGSNSLNKLVEILIRWRVHPFAFHTDVTKMYNRIFLDEAHWKYQLYLWVDGLDENVAPVWKVIKTMIYGVRSSGNIAECALRRTAESSKEEFPGACDVILFDTYMDDCISGESSHDKMHSVSDEIVASLAKGGFDVKGFTFSGEDPPEHLSKDGKSIHVAGLRWFPKGEFIKLNIKDLCFSRRHRGRIVDDSSKADITKRICAKVVYEIYDPLGMVAPIVAGMKLDISMLHQSHLGWDDPIPDELRSIWVANFDLIDELGSLWFKRAVVPENACSLDIETIETADAGENLICAAIYVRFKLRDGTFSCQLIFARTKIVHDLTIPRNEVAASLLNAVTGHVVRLSLKHFHKKSWKLTDSQVALHWINSTRTALKMWVRHRVVEILRLSDVGDWWYVRSKDMVADIGTRKGAKIDDVRPGSPWIDGYEWMSRHPDEFPIKAVSDLVLSGKDKTDFEKESIHDNFTSLYADARECYMKYVPTALSERYKFASYLIDPNRFRYQTVLRVLGLVFLFLSKISKGELLRKKYPSPSSFEFMRVRGFTIPEKKVYIVDPPTNNPTSTADVVTLPGKYLDAAKTYFFMKATREIQQFVDAKKYKNISILHDGILYYTSRILSTQEIDGDIVLGHVCLDLSASTFCVPIVDSLSPIAYAMVAETHWYHPDVNHGGVESILRLSQMSAYVLGGRELVKSISKACAKCRILHKKKVRVAMGPLGDSNFCIAPPFYFCQVDLCGPLKAYSPANKRATLKVWYVVFCCTTTGAVDCRIMEDYSADSFLLAFERFACRFGYPQTVLPDEGSQLVKGCEDMIISFSDVQQKMSRQYGIEFKTCPVGAHNVHGKVERKIREIRRSLDKCLENKRLSILQWETLGQQIANTINNTPIGLGNKSEMLESLDILTPNRLILGRNNNRSPSEPLQVSNDVRKILESNNLIYKVWFKEWLMGVVPTVVEKPKWFITDRHVNVGDVVLFLKSDKEFDKQYQYGLVVTTLESRDGLIRTVVVEYQNSGESIKRQTKRSIRDLVIIHPIDELGISKELYDFSIEQ